MTDTGCNELRLADGRTLAWQSFGDPQGHPLHVFHGLPGCRFQAALLHGPAQAAGVGLFAADRPGFGRSSPAPGRSILGWADDVAQLADALGHARFGVLGISCGGPYALACARRMPKRIAYTGLLAGIGPMDVPINRREQLPALKALFGLARVHPWLAAPFLTLDWLMFRRDAEKALHALARMLTAPDQALLAAEPEVARLFAKSLAEAYRQGIGGAMAEAALIAAPRGFRLEDVDVPVHLYQGGIDRNVPVAMASHMAECIPHARLRHYPEAGHLSVVVESATDCLADYIGAISPGSDSQD